MPVPVRSEKRCLSPLRLGDLLFRLRKASRKARFFLNF